MAEMTRLEAAWVKRLQRVLNDCPSDRMGFYTTGDSDVTVYDRSLDREIDDAQIGNMEFCNAVEECDATFAKVIFPGNVASTCA